MRHLNQAPQYWDMDDDRTADIIRSRLKGGASGPSNTAGADQEQDDQDESEPYAASEERFKELKRQEMADRAERDRQKEREENEADIYDPEEEGNILH